MPQKVKQRFHKYKVNAQTYYGVAPDYNLPYGSQWVDDVSEVQGELTKWQSKTDDWSQHYAKTLQKGLTDVQAGTSPYALDPQGTLTTQKALSEQATNEAAVAAGTMKKVPIGSSFGYIATGSAADLLKTNPQAYAETYGGEGVEGYNPPGTYQETKQVSYPKTNLTPGMTGNSVKQLQDYLVSKGYMTQAQVNTGYGTYGPQTKAAVLALQKAEGVDYSTGPGYWGPRTITAVSGAVSGGGTGTGDASIPFEDLNAPPQIKVDVEGTGGGVIDTTDYANLLGDLGSYLGLGKKADTDTTDTSGTSGFEDILKRYMETSTPPTDSTESYDKLSEQQGIEAKEGAVSAKDQAILDQQKIVLEKQAVVKSAQNELSLLQAQLADITGRGQQSQLTLESQAGTGKDVTSTFLGRQQQEITRQTAIKAIPMQAQILGAQAKIASAQGDVELAQGNVALAQGSAELSQKTLDMAVGKLNVAFQIQADYQDKLYNYNKDLRDRVFDIATDQEKNKLTALQRADDRAFTLFINNLNNIQSQQANAISDATNNGDYNIASKMIALNTQSPTFGQDLANLQAQIQPKAVAGGGGGGISPVDTAFFNAAKAIYADYQQDIKEGTENPWGTAWNRLKAQFPNKTDAEIDAALGKVADDVGIASIEGLKVTLTDGRDFTFESQEELNKFKTEQGIDITASGGASTAPTVDQFANSFGSGGFSTIPLSKAYADIKAGFALIGFSNPTQAIRKELLGKGYKAEDIKKITATGWEKTVEAGSSLVNWVTSMFK